MNSNSHGELFFLTDYVDMLRHLCTISSDEEELERNGKAFGFLFAYVVKLAEMSWQRPDSCFQHMPRLLAEVCEDLTKK